MRFAFLFVLAVVLFGACSGEEPSGKDASTVCKPEPWDQLACTCPTGVPGRRNCLLDGSGYGECEAPGCNCGTGTAHQCCMNDSDDCCPCVYIECSYEKMNVFLECVCQEGVCAAECDWECAGTGFHVDQTCKTCVDTAAQGSCKAQFDACK